MSASDDEVRKSVLALFGQCNNDVKEMEERIVRSLQESGRQDVKMETDGSGAVMVVSQGQSHAQGHLSFRQQLEQMHVDKTADAAKVSIGGIQIERVPNMSVDDERHQKRSASAAPPARKPGDTYRQHLDGSRRCFNRTEKDLKLASFPTSKYTGNYMLFRYGGAFPKHANYGFYRRFGTDGRGAVAAEFHNFPNGERPDTEHIYQ